MQEKVKPVKARLRELAPAVRGSQEAVFTQPSLHLFLHVCAMKKILVIIIVNEMQSLRP